MVMQQRLIDEFFELVRTDSETKQERAICDLLIRKFEALGLTVEEDDTAAKTGHAAGNLFATWPATPGMEDVAPFLFTGHMDTVAPGKGIQPRVDDDGFIRSDGTTILGSDDKAGLAAMFEAIRVVNEQGLPHGRIQFVITSGEESGLMGARAMDPARLDAKYGFALDSDGKIGEICTAGPTQTKLRVTVIGKSAHAGVNPQDGISAITVAAKAISRMPLGRIDHETTANIGRFEGGGETNVVADHVVITAEARSLVNEKMTAQIAKMREAFDSATKEFGATYDFQETYLYPAYKFDDDAPVVRVAADAFESLGIPWSTFPSGGGSDANIFNGMGVPTVNLAIGYEHIHTPKEQIRVSDLVGAARMVVAIIEQSTKVKVE
ncbi:M20/M25/M40 family metallo-hydrolase [Paenibacillus sp.]|uniref:M20/M25/M40 family metallo-hydrolase n=1 Tax=Paenibacillus sp. TaxID=58172 RepID=UPI002D6844D7|nr:M20/M25/M40 family metallo-hydrolase [Paenibacillus sp.]HZG55398.1 M20/M25/M40 family metallo-hydrolase [Paenibacillus sp.]